MRKLFYSALVRQKHFHFISAINAIKIARSRGEYFEGERRGGKNPVASGA